MSDAFRIARERMVERLRTANLTEARRCPISSTR